MKINHPDQSMLAIDLGGTRLKIGIVTATVVDHIVVRTIGKMDPLEMIADIGTGLLSDAEASTVGMCVPGIVANGAVLSLPGKLESIVDHNLLSFCQETFGLPAVVMNDALAYGIGEATVGAGRGASRIVVVTIGTGVGVAVLQDGQPLGGGSFAGGILGGHVPISDVASSTDSTGAHGTIEALCAAEHLVELTHGLYSSVADVLSAYASGDDDAVHAVNTYQQYLTIGLVALAHAHTPELIVVGGGPLSTSTFLLSGIEERVNERLYPGYAVRIIPALHGDSSALLGLANVAHRLPSGVA